MSFKQQMSDEQLMLMYQNGSSEAFQALYDRHSRQVFGYLKSKLKNDERAQEVFQEVFLKMHNSKHLYKSQYLFTQWIFTLSRSVLFDHLRKVRTQQKMTTQYEADLLIENQVSNAEPHRPQEISAANWPQAEKKLLELRYLEEKSFEELAKIFSSTPENMRQKVSRALKKVQFLALNRKGSK